MEELFRFRMTEEDLKEQLDALARCPGSRLRNEILAREELMLLLTVVATALLWLVGFLRGPFFWIWFVPMAGGQVLLHLVAARRYVSQQMRILRRQKKKQKSLPDTPDKEHRVFLRDGKYAHQAGRQAVNAVSLSTLRKAAPARQGGAVLLFESGMDDYLPARLFGPENTVQDFCSRMNGLAAEARQALVAYGRAEDTGGEALGTPAADGGTDGPRPLYALRFCLDGDRAVRLMSEGSLRRFSLPRRRKLFLRSLVLSALLLAAEWMIAGPVVALCIAVLPAALLGQALPPVNRAIYRSRLRRGGLDRVLEDQQIEFYENSVVIRRPSGEYEQQYSLFSTLMETKNAWFLVAGNAESLLPLPKSALPEEQHAAFRAFVEEKLAAAAAQAGKTGPAA